jgi:pilus assembly protein Flp/PilA
VQIPLVPSVVAISYGAPKYFRSFPVVANNLTEERVLTSMNRMPDFRFNRKPGGAIKNTRGSRARGEDGQGLVEYAMILMLVVIVVIAILVLLGPQVGSMFSSVTKNLS